jgi:hypothetical protein
MVGRRGNLLAPERVAGGLIVVVEVEEHVRVVVPTALGNSPTYTNYLYGSGGI